MKNVYSSQYQTTCFGHSWPSSGLTVPLKVPLCKSYDVEISTSITVIFKT